MDEVRRLARPDLVAPALVRATGDEGWRDVRAELITGGRSNLTFRLLSAAGELILRRPPSGNVLPTAHDMGRETRVQRVLAESTVPVPEIVLEDAGELIGVPFYVMTRVPGVVVTDTLPPAYDLEDRAHLGENLVDVLADLHTVDPKAVGLGDFGRPEGFAERQVRRWTRQIEATPAPPVDALAELAWILAQRPPVSSAACVVHGDYRLDNCVVDERHPKLNGVLDWEMSTLGDPLTDLGLLMFYWESVERLAPTLVRSVTTLPGFPGADAIAARWSAQTGIDVEDLDWYRAFAHFKFAAIVLGVQARVGAGAMGGQDFGDLSGSVVAIAEAGLEIV
ncbi:phosphotransferase family protein [Kineosporia mesophila]|uniref:Phosphotransferase family protein n=1 Tax=Kineosporia mesophila TaxID=566012 RepID=A0ABP7AJD2_9ACTN|nr:phosphotransferase family protein [Kineosporia mesophila]MCD5352429.1 phosphotransferase family protein [Kineosporia mesophila]